MSGFGEPLCDRSRPKADLVLVGSNGHLWYMREDRIVSVEIDGEGRLCVTPQNEDFASIYLAAMEVGWDPVRRCLVSPVPREWTYPMWFRQILAAAADEYGVRLTLMPETIWRNVSTSERLEMSAIG